MADDDDLWTFDVESVSKISSEPPDDDDPTYAVVFNVNGPDAMAEVEVFVEGPSDPAQIITRAMSKLHHALAAWAPHHARAPHRERRRGAGLKRRRAGRALAGQPAVSSSEVPTEPRDEPVANDPNADLAKKVAELEMNVQCARTETRGLMVALVVTISALDTIDPTRKADIMSRLQGLADTH